MVAPESWSGQRSASPRILGIYTREDIGLAAISREVAFTVDEVLRRDVHWRLVWLGDVELGYDLQGERDEAGDPPLIPLIVDQGVLDALVPETITGLVALDLVEMLRIGQRRAPCAVCRKLVVLDARRAGRARRGDPVYHPDCHEEFRLRFVRDYQRNDEGPVSTAHQHFRCRPMGSSVPAMELSQSLALDLSAIDLADRDALVRLVADHAIAPARRVWGLPPPVPDELAHDVSRQPVETDRGIDWIGPQPELEVSTTLFDPLIRGFVLFTKLFPGALLGNKSAETVMAVPNWVYFEHSRELAEFKWTDLDRLVAGLLGLPFEDLGRRRRYRPQRNDAGLAELAEAQVLLAPRSRRQAVMSRRWRTGARNRLACRGARGRLPARRSAASRSPSTCRLVRAHRCALPDRRGRDRRRWDCA